MEWCQPITFWCKTLVTPKYQAPYKAGRHIFWQQLLAVWFKTSCHYNWCVFILSISWSLIRIKIAVGISCQSNSFICWARHFDGHCLQPKSGGDGWELSSPHRFEGRAQASANRCKLSIMWEACPNENSTCKMLMIWISSLTTCWVALGFVLV